MSIFTGIRLPSFRDAELWKAECDQIDEQVAALVKRKRGIEALIAAARQLWQDLGMPSSASADSFSPYAELDALDPPRPGRPRLAPRELPPWIGLRATPFGRPLSELSPRAAPEDPMRHALTRRHSDKPLRWPAPRNAAAGGEARHSIINYRSTLLRPEPREAAPVAAVREAATTTPPLPEFTATPARPGRAEIGAAIIDFLGRVTVGAPGAVILAELRKSPALAELIIHDKTAIYDELSRLVDEGELVKGGGLYYRNRRKEVWAEAAE